MGQSLPGESDLERRDGLSISACSLSEEKRNEEGTNYRNCSSGPALS